MIRYMLTVFLGLGLACSSLPACAAVNRPAQERFITIGTGGIAGVYYPTGNAIAKIFNAKRAEHGMRLTAESTSASVFNINAVMSGELDFGIAQADRQHQAFNGLDEWQNKAKSDLRAVFSLAPEAVTFVAADDTGIARLADAKGKAIGIGNPGSGNRQNAIDVFEAAGLNPSKDIDLRNTTPADSPREMQDGRLDGFFYTVGHPNITVREAVAGSRMVHFVPINDIDPLLKKFPYYSRTLIKISEYPEASNKEDVQTVGMLATLVTSSRQPDDVVYALTREVFENLDELKSLHPALAGLTREGMLQGLTAPLHPGAVKYYKETGLMK